jgi:hypothetical protein
LTSGFLNHRPVSCRQPDDLAKKLLVHLPENISRDNRKLVWALGVVEAVNDLFEWLVVEPKRRRQAVRWLYAVCFRMEVEEA